MLQVGLRLVACDWQKMVRRCLTKLAQLFWSAGGAGLGLGGLVLLLALGGLSLPVLAQGNAGAGLDYQVGESFTIQDETRLRGLSGEYRGYTEREQDRRTYTIVDVQNQQVVWQVTSDFSYSDSDGGRQSERYEFEVKTDAETRAYLDGTFDGSAIALDYYTFDYIWFRIDPSLAPGSQLPILGQSFTIGSPTTINLGQRQRVEAIPARLNQPYSRQINNTEYDASGSWTLNVEAETYYYDPDSGYILRGEWQAEGETRTGNFAWQETLTLEDSSFPLRTQTNWIATIFTVASRLIPAIAIIGVVPFMQWRWRKQVDRLLLVSQDRISPRTTSRLTQRAVSAWNPASLDFHDLLPQDEQLRQASLHPWLELRNGLYLINDLNNHLGVVDTQADQYLNHQILPTELDNLTLLYRLALGVSEMDLGNSSQDSLPHSPPPTLDLSPYAVPSRGFACPDPYGISVYTDHAGFDRSRQPDYQATIELLARRRVLDFTLGQAPLSPGSHLKKVDKILQENPRTVLMVGDDDLVSVSLGRRGIAATVLEIDPYTCALIQGIATVENLPIQVWQHDLRRAFPRDFDGLHQRFDLFVTDSDFTIESFFLFLTRGLSLLRVGGVGLINFENKRSQFYKAHYLLTQLKVEILEEDKAQWRYVILRNTQVETGRVYRGKSVHINYRTEIGLAEARYSSVMFRIGRTQDTQILLQPNADFGAQDSSIYDYD